MLRAKIYINTDEIDDIQIINTGKKANGESEYRVKAPIDFYVWHKRQDGWEHLLIKVLKIFELLRNE